MGAGSGARAPQSVHPSRRPEVRVRLARATTHWKLKWRVTRRQVRGLYTCVVCAPALSSRAGGEWSTLSLEL